MAKLTMGQARIIRYRYINEKVTKQALADEYGVTPTVIYLILKNETYKE